MTSLSSLMSELDSLEAEGKHLELSTCILKVMIKNIDASPLAGKIIKYLALPSPPLKKVMYSFLIRYARKISDLNILATNSLLKDFQDPNPFMRKLVIKTASSIECLSELAFQLLPKALEDPNANVRSSAAISSSLIINESNIDGNQDIINKLYEMIRDSDSSVICSCLVALEEILQFDGGVVVNSKMVAYLISRISEFQEWNFSVLCMVLKKYSPKTSDELICFLNALDEKLLCSNPVDFILAANVALQYISELQKNLSSDILLQIFPQLKFLLINSNNELLFALLEMVHSFLPTHKDIFVPCKDLFLCTFSDSTIIKVKKLEILVHFVDSNNAIDMSEEFLLHCVDIEKEVSHQAVQSYILILKQYPLTNYKDFISLIDITYNNLNEDILNSLSDLDFNKLSAIKEQALDSISQQAQLLNTKRGKFSLLKLIGNYGKEIKSSPYIIEQFVNNIEDPDDEVFLNNLLTATVKLFLVRPQEMYLILGHLLQWAEKSPCILIQKQAPLYYNLLKNFNEANNVLLDKM